jgi:uncharacterized membrane protein YfcA
MASCSGFFCSRHLSVDSHPVSPALLWDSWYQALWLHILTPVQTTALIVGYGLLTQGYGVWKLRHALAWKSIAPFIVGGLTGVPIGTMLLTYLNPAYLRSGVGVLLVIYGAYGLAQPALKPLPSNRLSDTSIGLANGIWRT